MINGVKATNPSEHRRQGHYQTVSPAIKQQLIAAATTNSHTRRLALSSVGELGGVRISARVLRRMFASEGYHRRVARVKPFLTTSAKAKRKAWSEQFSDWDVGDWADVIWSDECAISVGDVSGTVWVTRKPGQEYLEDCLVPKFPRQTTIMIWGCIYRDLKGPLVIWDLANWGTINRPTYVNNIIRPHLFPWWT